MTFKKVLIKLNLDRVMEDYSITFEGTEPKLCTGFITGNNFVLVPIRELIKQGVNLHATNLDWYERGDVLVDGIPCKYFFISEVDILCS